MGVSLEVQRYFKLQIFLLFRSALQFSGILMLTTVVMDASEANRNARGRPFGYALMVHYFRSQLGSAVVDPVVLSSVTTVGRTELSA